jgi:hypothetical protein
VDPLTLEYRKEDVIALPKRLAKGELRLDEDEREHSLFLSKLPGLVGREYSHIETIHLNKPTSDIELIPTVFRVPLLNIIAKYTNGFTKLEGGSWNPVNFPKEL